MASKIPEALGDVHPLQQDANLPRNTIICSFRNRSLLMGMFPGVPVQGDIWCPDNYAAHFDELGELTHIYLVKDRSNELHNDVVWC